MKKKFKNILIGLSCGILSFMMLGNSGGGKTARAYEHELVAVENVKVFDSAQKNQRLMEITLEHISTNMDSKLKISNIKELEDFAGNRYILFELSPIGYIIYHVESGKYIEYAEQSISPYYGLTEDLYYGGAMQYYQISDNMLLHTLKSDVFYNLTDMEYFVSTSETLHERFCENPMEENLSYINGTRTRYVVDKIQGVVENNQTMSSRTTTARISMADFFSNLYTASEIGYRNGGVCGYIATNLIIGYNYFAFDYGLITNSSYVNQINKSMNGPGLTNRLLELAGENPANSSFDGTYSADMHEVLGEYLDEVYNLETWEYSWYFLGLNVQSTLDDNYPVALFGNLASPTNLKDKGNHAVVAYDYAKYGFLNLGVKYRVHYGWEGYPSVWLEDPLLGSNLFMKIG